MPVDAVPTAIAKLHSIFEIEGRRLVMATHLMGAIPQRQLGRPVTHAWNRYDEIVAAIDMIFLGF